jgi:hypothetical protein
MAIASAVKRGPYVFVYDERGNQTAAIYGGDKPEDGLQAYTATTVRVRRGSFIYYYDARGSRKRSMLSDK